MQHKFKTEEKKQQPSTDVHDTGDYILNFVLIYWQTILTLSKLTVLL